MDDSIFAILAAIAIGLIQVVTSINKKKKAREQAMRPPSDAHLLYFDMEETEEPEIDETVYRQEKTIAELATARPRMLRPEEEGGPMAQPIQPSEAEASEDEDFLLHDFTPQKAIIFSEMLNQRWNS